MRQLLKFAFRDRKNVWILIFSLVFALFFTVTTQLEMFSLGLVTKKGPDVFELFGTEEKGRLKSRAEITKDELLIRFDQIAGKEKEIITKADVEQFLESHEREGLVDRGWAFLQKRLPIDTNVFALIIVLVSIAISKAITLFCYRFGTKAFSIRISRELRNDYFHHLQSLPMSFYLKHNIGALSSRAINDGYVIADGINSLLVNYVQTPFALISTLILCFSISWKLSIAIFFGLPLIIAPIIFLARRIKRISKEIQKKQESFSSVLIEFITGIQTIKLFSMEEFSMQKYKEQNTQLAKLELKSARYDISARPVLHAVGMVCLITALMFGLWGLKLPLHEVLFFCGLLSGVYEPLKKFAEENGRIQRGIAACERMWDVLSLPPERDDESDELKQTTVNFLQSVEFKNVSFGYNETKPVLQDVSFTISKGQMVAIVGATGSGKSTLVSLLTQLFKAQEGEILIDGVSIEEYTHNAIRQFISVVPQKPFLFHDTIIENVRFGRPFSEAQVLKACQKAHADSFIQTLPSGYNSVIGEAGKTLSGGQLQRLAIARALLKGAPVLILDEATSSLDTVSEHHIKLALQELKGNVTQIVIAHRLSTIEEADKIIVLDEGRKVGEGTCQELLTTCPQFAMMWKLSGLQHIKEKKEQVSS